jgi:acetyl esterase
VPTSDREQLADQELAAYVAELRADPGPAVSDIGADGLRQASRRRSASRSSGPELDEVRDLTVPGSPPVRVRVYRPVAAPRPLLVFFHGGGWTIGDLESHDRLCRRMALGADVAVLAVDYRRAPESPWPAALSDAVEVVRWVFDNGGELCGTADVAVGGDSAGGNIAALTCLLLRDREERLPLAQVLICPNTDLTLSRASIREKASGWGLDAAELRWFTEQWVPDVAMRSHPRVSPLLEPDLADLPEALVVTAEHDPLRDEGDAYAAALSAAGVRVRHRCEPGLVHGFLGMDTFSPAARSAGERLFAEIGSSLRPR